jgi:BCD family chlorophyll transporter-like MFS transporter
VILSGAFGSTLMFRVGAMGIGFGGGLFSLGSLSAFMKLRDENSSGLVLGAWGAVQATCAGIAIAVGAGLKDLIVLWGHDGALGPLLQSPAAAYGLVYQLEIILLFALLVEVGPLVAKVRSAPSRTSDGFGLAEFPS